PGECCALSERTSRYPAAYTGRTGHGKTIPHASERKPGECSALSQRTLRYPAIYTGRTSHGKTIPHASQRNVDGSTVLSGSFYSPVNSCLVRTNITIPRRIYRADGHGKIVRMHQNARSVDPQFCSETFHSAE
ncbi:hypothetical protein TNCT_419741, partial [Trichonephila clavata]